MQTIDLDSPVQAELIIHIVQGKIINSKRTMVKVIEFTTTSLKFISSLRFPVSEKVVYKMTFKIFGRAVEVYGMILTTVKKDEAQDYYYEMTFKIS